MCFIFYFVLPTLLLNLSECITSVGQRGLLFFAIDYSWFSSFKEEMFPLSLGII